MNVKLVKWIAAVLIVIVALVLCYSALNGDTGKKENDLVFVSYEPADIENIKIANSYGAYEVTKDEDGYTVADFPASIVDQEGFFELMYHSSAYGALKKVDETNDNLALYGLNNPSAIFCTTFSDGKSITIRLGDKEKVSGNYYGSVDGKDGVYLFAEEDVIYFLVKKETYISLQVTPELAVSSPLSAIKDITFSGSALEKPIEIKAVVGGSKEIKLQALSFGAPTHLVRLKGIYQLDQTYGIKLFNSVLGLKALDILGYNMSDSDLSKLGFDEPYMKVSFGLKNGTDYIADFELSVIPFGEYYLASTKGTGLVFIIDRPDFLGIDYTKLCQRWFLTPLRKDLENLIVSFDNESFTFVSGTDANGNNYAKVNGKDMDIEQFYAFYRLVTSAMSDGLYLEDTQISGNPLITVTYNYLNTDKTPDIMTLYKGSARRAKVDVNGCVEFDMKDSYVDVLKNACHNAVSGKPIDETW